MYKIQHTPLIDHKSVIMYAEINQKEMSYNLLKLNNCFLSEEKFLQERRNLITTTLNKHHDIHDLRVRYAILKFNIQQYCIKYVKCTSI